MSSRNGNVIKYRKRKRITLGSVIFLFIFVYMVIISVSYFSRKHLSIYEVVEKEIADDDTCQGIILRDEKVYTNDQSGYISFYVRDGDKVAKASTVYAVDESGKIYDMLASSETTQVLSDSDSTKIRNYIRTFQRNFQYSTFDKVENLKYNVDKTLLDYTNLALSDTMKDLMKENDQGTKLTMVKAKQPGIFTSVIDGLEGISQDSVTTKTFEKEINKSNVTTEKAVAAGTSVYKLVTSEKWSIILNLSKEQYKKLFQKAEDAKENNIIPKIQIRFTENDLEMTVPYEVYTKGGGYFAKLTLEKYMGTFIDDRFLDIQIVFHTAEGLKIPKSAVLEKKFYVVPASYLTAGGDDDSLGVVKQVTSEKGKLTYEFTKADVISKDDEYAYIEGSGFKAGDVIQNSKTQETYQIGKTKKMTGVYNVNKGYCVFRQIEKEYENDEYLIVKKGTYNGLSNYDHILLDVSTAGENEIIK